MEFKVKEKCSILYYKDWAELAIQMPDEMQLAIFKAINRYMLYKESPTMDNPCYWVFMGWQKQIERDFTKYEAMCEKNSANGKKGGRPRKETEQNPKNPPLFEKAKKADNDNDNDNDIDNDKEKDIDKDKERDIIYASLSLEEIFGIIDNDILDNNANRWYKEFYKTYTNIWYLTSNHYSFSPDDFIEVRDKDGIIIGDEKHRADVIKSKLCAIDSKELTKENRFGSIKAKVKEYLTRDL